MKTFSEVKAEPMTTSQLDRWLSGKIPRRLLVLPFGGPIPSAKTSLGVDLDAEWFDGDTDRFGPFLSLRSTRDRLVDWHHDDMGVPDSVSRMKGVILGRVVLDEDPEDEGVWADWWAKAGERRLALVAALERRSVPLYGSSQAVTGAVRKADTGHIEVWPLIRHTITTSPQNTLAVVPALKGLLDSDLNFDEVGVPALRAALAGLNEAVPDLRRTFLPGGERDGASSQAGGDVAAKADPVLSAKTIATLRSVLGELDEFVRSHEPGLRDTGDTSHE